MERTPDSEPVRIPESLCGYLAYLRNGLRSFSSKGMSCLWIGLRDGGTLLCVGAKHPDLRFRAIDSDASLVERTAERLADAGLKNVSCARAESLSSYSEQAGPFDMAVCMRLFRVRSQTREAIRSVFGNLGSDGVAAFAEEAWAGRASATRVAGILDQLVPDRTDREGRLQFLKQFAAVLPTEHWMRRLFRDTGVIGPGNSPRPESVEGFLDALNEDPVGIDEIPSILESGGDRFLHFLDEYHYLNPPLGLAGSVSHGLFSRLPRLVRYRVSESLNGRFRNYLAFAAHCHVPFPDRLPEDRPVVLSPMVKIHRSREGLFLRVEAGQDIPVSLELGPLLEACNPKTELRELIEKFSKKGEEERGAMLDSLHRLYQARALLFLNS